MESNDSPEIPDRKKTSPASLRGPQKEDTLTRTRSFQESQKYQKSKTISSMKLTSVRTYKNFQKYFKFPHLFDVALTFKLGQGHKRVVV